MARSTLQDLLSLWANVPILLALRRLEKSYAKDLEHELRCDHKTIRKSLNFLMEAELISTLPPDGKVLFIKEYIVLTPLGRDIASCIADCETKVGAKLRRRK